ncbi:phage tail protein [Pandoraea sp.]|uniref:phage tail protein n=1 Tax=Pandoraea sp. TaxID=1883445 RepID=UPI001206A49C|nr:phage tail protein [Pandoraea sp.]TAL53806.1 MAG: phage tail protein [Pandoraea sp.]TAM17059.1 MAG: phage tail protein [Pandoraea sp.]
MMMTWGMFVFSLGTLPYQALQQQLSWRHPANLRVGQRARRQFLGQGEDTITLEGVLLPELTGGSLSLDALKSLGDDGRAWPLIEGTGKIHGLYALESLDVTRTLFFADGAARRIEFRMTLQRCEDDERDRLGTLTDLPGWLR